MLTLPFTDRDFMQFCWVVPDIDKSMAEWTRRTGIGPFFKFDKVQYTNPIYRGKPSGNPDITAAIAQAGNVQIELVMQNDDMSSIWRETVPAGKMGFHHAAVYCRDYEKTLAEYKKAGNEIIFTGLMMGYPVDWIDTVSTLGFMTELICANPVAEKIFGQFRSAAENWDGKNPVRGIS